MKKSHNPSTWNESDWKNYNKPCREWNAIEWANVYKLYNATQLWESDESLEFEDFKLKVQRKKKFADLHRIQPGMDKPDYDPWRTADDYDTLETSTCEFINDNGNVYTFTKQEDDRVLWEGDFKYMTVGGSPENASFVNPSGGPFIRTGQMLSHIIHYTNFNVIVESFERVDTGFVINVKKHKYDPNDFSHLDD